VCHAPPVPPLSRPPGRDRHRRRQDERPNRTDFAADRFGKLKALGIFPWHRAATSSASHEGGSPGLSAAPPDGPLGRRLAGGSAASTAAPPAKLPDPRLADRGVFSADC